MDWGVENAVIKKKLQELEFQLNLKNLSVIYNNSSFFLFGKRNINIIIHA